MGPGLILASCQVCGGGGGGRGVLTYRLTRLEPGKACRGSGRVER